MKKIMLVCLFAFLATAAFSQIKAVKGLEVGNPSSPNKVRVDSITKQGTNYRIYSAGTMLSPTSGDTVSFGEVGVYKKDTVNVIKGSYATRHDLKFESTKLDYVKTLNKYGAGIKLTPLMPAGGAYVGGSNQMIDGRATYILAEATDTVTLTTFDYQMHGSGNYTTDAGEFNGMAIYSISGTTATRIGITANTPTAWSVSSSDRASINLTAPVTLVPGLYYVGFLYNYLVQTTAPYIIGYQPSHVFTNLPLNTNLRLGVWVGTQATFPSSFTINPAYVVGILHNFIGR